MPTPETEPFRLTRDMVAPMGIWNQSIALWSIIYMETTFRQFVGFKWEYVIYSSALLKLIYIYSAASETNLTAERALLRVTEKLEGKDQNRLGALDVEVHVQRLINEATNVRNLCRLYPGWDPYL